MNGLNVRISVLLATYNGASTIERTLQSILCQGRDDVEIIVIDNASTDDTATLLRQYESSDSVVVLREDKPGKSRALQRGIVQCRGRLVVFTDDDIIAEPGWLDAFEHASCMYDDAALFQGQVRHEWESRPPSWLVRLAEDGMSYAGTPLDKAAGPIGASQLKGPNFAVRRDVLDSVPMMRSDTGTPNDNDTVTLNRGVDAATVTVNRASHFTGGIHQSEDTDFAYRATAAGYRLRYVPKACIRHIVRSEQIGIKPVLQRYFRIGRAIGEAQARNPISTAGISSLRTALTASKLAYKAVTGSILFLIGFRYAGMRRLVKVATGSGKIYQRVLARRYLVRMEQDSRC